MIQYGRPLAFALLVLVGSFAGGFTAAQRSTLGTSPMTNQPAPGQTVGPIVGTWAYEAAPGSGFIGYTAVIAFFADHNVVVTEIKGSTCVGRWQIASSSGAADTVEYFALTIHDVVPGSAIPSELSLPNYCQRSNILVSCGQDELALADGARMFRLSGSVDPNYHS